MVCNNSSIHHDRNCPSHKNNALKGAAVNQQPTTKQYVFNSEEVGFLGRSLESLRNFVIKNQSQYQNPQDIIKELTTANNIISARTKQNKQNEQSLKGASSLDNIRKMFGLNNNINISNQLKGVSTANNNVPLCDKTKSLINLKQHFGLT